MEGIIVHTNVLLAVQGLLRLEETTLVFRQDTNGLFCAGKSNSCTNRPALLGYCVLCSLRVQPELMSIRQVFEACGANRIVIRNGVRYRLCGRQPKRLCCGARNTCSRLISRGCLCRKHHTKYVGALGSTVTVIDGIKMKKDDGVVVRICDYNGCNMRCTKLAYCSAHQPI